MSTDEEKQNYYIKLMNTKEHVRELIYSTLDFDELMNRIIVAGSKAISCETASISLKQQEQWVIKYTYGFKEDLEGNYMKEDEDPHAVLAINTRKPVIINDAYNDERVNLEHMKKLGIRSVIVVPLVTREQAIGVIFFNYYEIVHDYDRFTLDFIKDLASSISMALQNVKLYEEACAEILARKAVEESLIQANNKLNLTLKSAGVGMWELDLKTNKQVWSSNVYESFGLDPYKPIPEGVGIETVYPDDREMIQLSLLETYKNKNEFWNNKFRIISPKLGLRWVAGTWKILYDEEGNPKKIIGANVDITYIQLQQEQLLKAEKEKNENLKKVISMKDEFLSLISHEFKTPITVINSAIQTMELICKDELSPKAIGYLNAIQLNSQRQLKLVNNILDITRINSNRFEINIENVDIVSLTNSVTESIRIFAEQKDINISFCSTIKEKFIGIDSEKYERILLNLLSNAVKYTTEGKSISVKLSQKKVEGNSKVCIQVIDKGIGIPPDKLEKIFERFGKVDNSLSRQAEGSGIGLYLVKLLIELMEGDIEIESREGKGSKFTIFLPVKKAAKISQLQVDKSLMNNKLKQSVSIEFSDVY